ncbi:hypothetical protein CE195_02645 [Sodalis-like symbiont of Philaenus spumarius]|nr:hypothetical protein CE195_02645 [Sodalis-like symbiont of Philaenus spumarius]
MHGRSHRFAGQKCRPEHRPFWYCTRTRASTVAPYCSKALQHWLWCAYNTKTGGVLAYTFGPRTDG